MCCGPYLDNRRRTRCNTRRSSAVDQASRCHRENRGSKPPARRRTIPACDPLRRIIPFSTQQQPGNQAASRLSASRRFHNWTRRLSFATLSSDAFKLNLPRPAHAPFQESRSSSDGQQTDAGLRLRGATGVSVRGSVCAHIRTLKPLVLTQYRNVHNVEPGYIARTAGC